MCILSHARRLEINFRVGDEARTLALSRDGFEWLKDAIDPKVLDLSMLILENELLSLLVSMQTSELHLNECRIEGCSSGVRESLAANSRLTTLGLNFCTIDDMSATQIAAGIAGNSGIETILCGVSGTSQIEAYSKILTLLTMLVSLEEFYFDIKCDWTPTLIESFCVALGNDVGIKSVFVTAYGQDLSGANPWPSIALCLQNNPGVAKMSWNGVVDEGVFRLIGRALSRNTKLEFLISTDNGRSKVRTEQGLIDLIDGLGPNTTLKCLHLRVDVDVSSLPLVYAAFKRNFGIEHFSGILLFHNVGPCDDGVLKRQLEVFGKLNKAGRRYLLKEAWSKGEGVSVLSEIVDDLDCLYFHLRENPGLCDIRTKSSPTRPQSRKRRIEEAQPEQE